MTGNTPECTAPTKQVQRKQLLSKGKSQIGPYTRSIAIEAPAGYGKSVFSRQLVDLLVDRLKGSCVWRSLTPTDNDVVSFISCWLKQLGEAIPDFDMPELQGLQTKREEKPTAHARFAKVITTKLAAQNNPVLLVFDDLHLINNSPALGFITELIQSAADNIYFLLISRDPIIPALGVCTPTSSVFHVTHRDLAFSRTEISELYQQVLEINLPIHQIASLDEKTNGWAMGLMLLEPALRQHQHTPSDLPTVSLTEEQIRQLDQYFQAQLFNHWPSQITDTFTRLALLDPVPLALAAQFSQSFDLQTFLHHCPFVSVGDDKLKIHPLLVDCLRFHAQKELTPEQRNAIYRYAADWYSTQGTPDIALHYHLKAGDFEIAHNQLRETGLNLRASNQQAQLRNLLDGFPLPWPESWPWLWFFDGITRSYSDPRGALQSLLKAKDLLCDDPINELTVLSSLIQYHFIIDSNFNQMRRYTKRAEQLYRQVNQQLPPQLKCLTAYSISTGLLLVHSTVGKVLHYCDEALRIAEEMQLETLRALIMTTRGLTYAFLGDYPAFLNQLERARELFTSPKVTAEAKVALWLLRLRSCTLCHIDEPTYTREKRLANHQLPDTLPEKTLFIPWLAVLDARFALSQGDTRSALKSIGHGLELPTMSRVPHYRSILLHYESLALALKGDTTGSDVAANKSTALRRLSEGRFYTYQNQVICATAALLRHDYYQCRMLLSQALPEIRSMNDNQYIAAALIPLALAHQQMGEHSDQWQPLLEEALSIMRQQQYMTLWNWTPKLMLPALVLALEHNIEPDYTAKLLAQRLTLAITAKGKLIPLLQVHDLGGFSISVADQVQIEEQTLTGTQLKLLALLLSEPNHRAGYDEISSALWPDEGGNRRNRVETVISRLRKTLTATLKHGQGNDYLMTDKKTVRLCHCVVDSVQFLRYIDQGFNHICDKQYWQAETAFEQARQYWTGNFFQYIDLPDKPYLHQANLADRFGQMASALAHLLINSDELERASTVALNAFNAEPKEMHLARLLHDLYNSQGKTKKCLAVVQHFKAALQEHGYTEEEITTEMEVFYSG